MGEGLAFRRLDLAVLSGDIVKRAAYMRASKFNSRSEVVLCYFIVIFVRFLKYLKSMINKRMSPKWLSGMVWGVVLLLASCRTDFAVVKVEGDRVAMDSTWDNYTNQQAISLLAPYKMKVDSAMSSVLGMAAISMDRERPESLLSNLVADVLREAATDVLGKPADMGLVNIGGIRSSLTQGSITMEDAYEILPFENALCVLKLKGNVMRELLENIAARMGEGVSGVHLDISREGKLLDARVGGLPLEDDREYTVATLDYLAEGNDGMHALPKAVSRTCPPGQTLRLLFIRYVEQQAKAGRKVTSRLEGRVTVKE